MQEPSPFIRWTIERAWDGSAAPPSEHVVLELTFSPEALMVRVDAPFHADPAPPAPPGSTDELWSFEVVELFLLALPDHYLEIELGPHGHHLVLELRGRRHAVRSKLPIDYQARIRDSRWQGLARIHQAYLPPGASRGNGYAIHGDPPQRRYLAYYPVPGRAPDFHRLDRFGPLR